MPAHPGAIRDLYGHKEASATRLGTTPPLTSNKRKHIIFCGGRYDSGLSYCEGPPVDA